MDYLYRLLNLVRRWTSYFGLIDSQNFEDRFYQLLRDKNYDEALKLAQQNNFLDIDMVYKCKWRSGGITVQSIKTILGSIQDKLWAINECVQTVPISYEACSALIQFGLNEANMKLLYQLGNEEKQVKLNYDISEDTIEGSIDFNNLNDQQSELCRCRQDLLRHEHSLLAYKEILGDRTIQQHFDHVFYDEFRQKCPLNACIDYAHDGDAKAVAIMLNFYTDDLTTHLLPILSNMPETLSPYQYRYLLPCLREGDVVYEWRTKERIKRETSDWSSQSDASKSLSVYLKNASDIYVDEFYESHEYLKKYLKSLTADVLSQWFRERALDIEARTLLLLSAMQLLQLGIDLSIKNLKDTLDDLMEFDRIVDECCTENNLYLSFTEFNKMNQIDRLVLMTGDSVKSCKDRFRFYVIPYLHRREERLGFEGKANTLKQYFRQLAHQREHICGHIYSDLLDKIEYDNFVAEWTKDMDDILDEIGEEIKAIERDRHAKQLSSIVSQTLALGDLNESYEVCQLIMNKGYKECWPLCCQLGMHKEFSDNEAKYKLLSFALAYCNDPDGRISAKILNYIIELRKRDEKVQLAYLQLNM